MFEECFKDHLLLETKVASFIFSEITVPTENMFSKLKFYLWVMGWSGAINSWAWRKQASIIKDQQQKENEEYLKELKNKL